VSHTADYYDYDDGPDDPCDHEEYEIDILTGRAECSYCPHSWYATSGQIAAEIEHHRQYAEWEAREHRRERIVSFFAPITGLVSWARKLFVATDELPF